MAPCGRKRPTPAMDGRRHTPKDRKTVKAITGIGIAVAPVGMPASAVMEAPTPVPFLNIPPLLLIPAGTGGAVMASTNMKSFLNMPKLAITAVKGADHDPHAT